MSDVEKPEHAIMGDQLVLIPETILVADVDGWPSCMGYLVALGVSATDKLATLMRATMSESQRLRAHRVHVVVFDPESEPRPLAVPGGKRIVWLKSLRGFTVQSRDVDL